MVDDGDDDCGEDLQGLGCGACCTDVSLGTDSDEDGEAFIALPAGLPVDAHADVFSIIPTVSYGRNNEVDMLELCGGNVGVSHVAFSRGLSPGGNFDKRSYVDFGNKEVQDA
eukprot:7724129-Pyramimonas_sp.AAC.1